MMDGSCLPKVERKGKKVTTQTKEGEEKTQGKRQGGGSNLNEMNRHLNLGVKG